MKAEEIARTSVDGRQSGDNPTAFQRLDLAVQETGFEEIAPRCSIALDLVR